MKSAYFSKKFNVLSYFSQKNVSENVNCSSVKQARLIIKKSNVEQILKTN